ncbi:MAG: hypothetical protein PVG92_04945, partial [Holophagae bacterium]
ESHEAHPDEAELVELLAARIGVDLDDAHTVSLPIPIPIPIPSNSLPASGCTAGLRMKRFIASP